MNAWQAFSLSWLLITCCSHAGPASEGSDQTDKLLEAIRTKHRLPGLACAVIRQGQLCELAAVGVRKQGDPTPLTTNDLFHIGSCTKSMTATLGGVLIDQGLLRWDTSVGEIFPELKQTMDPQYLGVTFEQLLTHRAGIAAEPPAQAWQRAWEQKGTPTAQRYEFIQAVLRQPPRNPPGTRYLYSNQGYAVAGAMLERITGVPYEQLLTERIFRPLHMGSAGFGPPGTLGRVDQPWGHMWDGSRIVPLQQDNPPAIGPAGTVHCSLGDLAKYVICHLHGERKGGLVTQATFGHLHTAPPGGDYACGWICAKRDWAGGTALTHTGSNNSWFVVLWLAPERDFALIIATNTGAKDAFQACDEMAAALIKQWQRSPKDKENGDSKDRAKL